MNFRILQIAESLLLKIKKHISWGSLQNCNRQCQSRRNLFGNKMSTQATSQSKQFWLQTVQVASIN